MPDLGDYDSYYIGRKVVTKDGRQGVVKFAENYHLGEPTAGAIPAFALRMVFCVEWSDGGASSTMGDAEVADIATEEFVEEDWVNAEVIMLQKAGFDRSKLVVTRCATTAAEKKPAKKKAAAKDKPVSRVQGQTSRLMSLAEVEKLHSRTTTPAMSPATSPPAAKRPKVAAVAVKINHNAARPLVPNPPSVRKVAFKSSAPRAASQSLATQVPDRASPSCQDRPRVDSSGAGPSSANARPRSRSTAGAASSGLENCLLLHSDKMATSTVKDKTSRKRIDVFRSDRATVGGDAYRIYSQKLILLDRVCKSGADLDIKTWKVNGEYEETEDGEWHVDCIVAQRDVDSLDQKKAGRGKGRGRPQQQFLIKYTGFELDPGPDCWLDLAEVNAMASYDAWLKEGRKAWLAGMNAVLDAAGILPRL